MVGFRQEPFFVRNLQVATNHPFKFVLLFVSSISLKQPVLKYLYRYLLCFALLLVINLILFALDRGFSFETQPSSITVKFSFNKL
ncbi:hypothetical protein F0562_011840 [Nyssa sinensis]|uniref:Uncharacterized protein n=1 Tax=Nyssa sinensis TaxID=561372 RepID=A0A5J4ZR41_9ASTE|nr:hypothetical protein F0562_011840 [Nyssa sinensis]